jgi:hypothetical protein
LAIKSVTIPSADASDYQNAEDGSFYNTMRDSPFYDNHDVVTVEWTYLNPDHQSDIEVSVQLCALSFSVLALHQRCVPGGIQANIEEMLVDSSDWAECARKTDEAGKIYFNFKPGNKKCQILKAAPENMAAECAGEIGWFVLKLDSGWEERCVEDTKALDSTQAFLSSFRTSSMSGSVPMNLDFGSNHETRCAKDDTFLKARVGLQGDDAGPEVEDNNGTRILPLYNDPNVVASGAYLDKLVFNYSSGKARLKGNTAPTMDRASVSVLPQYSSDGCPSGKRCLYTTTPVVSCGFEGSPKTLSNDIITFERLVANPHYGAFKEEDVEIESFILQKGSSTNPVVPDVYVPEMRSYSSLIEGLFNIFTRWKSRI